MLIDVMRHLIEFPDGKYEITKTIQRKFLWAKWESQYTVGYFSIDKRNKITTLCIVDLERFDKKWITYKRYFLLWDGENNRVQRRAFFHTGIVENVREEQLNASMSFDMRIRQMILGNDLHPIHRDIEVF